MMKRLPITLAVLVLVAGCASQPPSQGPSRVPGDKSQTGQSMPAPGQTQPLPTRDRDWMQPASGGDTDNGTAPAQNNNNAANATAPVTQAPPRDASQVSSPAVMSLLRRADTLAQNGNMDDAAATLERALDLDPRNPFIYQRLATVRMAQDQAGQAEQLAMKSNSVAGDNPFVAADNWRLIAQARQSSGDSRGAQAANSRAASYSQSADQFNR